MECPILSNNSISDVPPATESGKYALLGPSNGDLMFPELSGQRPRLHVFTVGFSSTESVVACLRNVSDKIRRKSRYHSDNDARGLPNCQGRRFHEDEKSAEAESQKKIKDKHPPPNSGRTPSSSLGSFFRIDSAASNFEEHAVFVYWCPNNHRDVQQSWKRNMVSEIIKCEICHVHLNCRSSKGFTDRQ